MNAVTKFTLLALASLAWLMTGLPARAQTVYQVTSAYHHISVIDRSGYRVLSFNGSWESRVSLANPLVGHFEYCELFHTPWLWNPAMTNVLVVGLGGGSTQRLYQHYYPFVNLDTVELDPAVVSISKYYFQTKETARHKIHTMDGRVYLRRTQKKYDAILMDAYSTGRYGSFIPYHLATKEFFTLASANLTENGVLCYNVIGNLNGFRADILGSVYKTMRSVFPQVWMFPASDTGNVVLVATKSKEPVTLAELEKRARSLAKDKVVTLPNFDKRVRAFRAQPPANLSRVSVLTDEYAPVDGVLTGTNRR